MSPAAGLRLSAKGNGRCVGILLREVPAAPEKNGAGLSTDPVAIECLTRRDYFFLRAVLRRVAFLLVAFFLVFLRVAFFFCFLIVAY
ncbi:MAG: hypothetical protein EA377_00650 [Phycisphaerales bacterium]|nr:MAG: hypothetical protein EA377_00650 [Phycisphaerales bacterium]